MCDCCPPPCCMASESNKNGGEHGGHGGHEESSESDEDEILPFLCCWFSFVLSVTSVLRLLLLVLCLYGELGFQLRISRSISGAILPPLTIAATFPDLGNSS